MMGIVFMSILERDILYSTEIKHDVNFKCVYYHEDSSSRMAVKNPPGILSNVAFFSAGLQTNEIHHAKSPCQSV